MAYRQPTNLTSINGMFDYAQEVTGFFYIGMILSLFFIVLLWLKGKGYSTPDCMVTASFSSLILCVFLIALGSIPSSYLGFVLAVGIGSGAWSYITRND